MLRVFQTTVLDRRRYVSVFVCGGGKGLLPRETRTAERAQLLVMVMQRSFCIAR